MKNPQYNTDAVLSDEIGWTFGSNQPSAPVEKD